MYLRCRKFLSISNNSTMLDVTANFNCTAKKYQNKNCGDTHSVATIAGLIFSVCYRYSNFRFYEMSSLRRTLSLRKSKRSYKTLHLDGQSSAAKPTILGEVGDKYATNRKLASMQLRSTPVPASAKQTAGESSEKSVKHGMFPTMDTVKSALTNVKQVIATTLLCLTFWFIVGFVLCCCFYASCWLIECEEYKLVTCVF